jgi:hypothetical protein
MIDNDAFVVAQFWRRIANRPLAGVQSSSFEELEERAMSSYQVLVEKAPDGFFSATVIGVPECTAEGATKEEALENASARLKERLARGELFTIEGPPAQAANELNIPVEHLRRGSPRSVLKAAGRFLGDEQAMQQHIDEIYAERRAERLSDEDGVGQEGTE